MLAGAKWAEGLLFVLAAVIYLSFSLPWYVDLVVLLGLGVIAVRSTWREMTLLLVSLLLAALTLEAFLPGEGAQVFYREHEKWAREASYQPRVADHIAVPHGDLTALDPGARSRSSTRATRSSSRTRSASATARTMRASRPSSWAIPSWWPTVPIKRTACRRS